MGSDPLDERPRVRSLWQAPRIRQFLSFLGGSAVGLAIDLLAFALLLVLGLQPWLANAISSTLALTAVYFLVARYSFGARARISTYVLFFAWYGATIVLVSLFVDTASSLSGWAPLVWKLISIPISFVSNFLFSRYLFRPRGPKTG